MSQVGGVFWNLSGSNTNPEIQAVERVISPVSAKHYSDIGMNGALFARIDALWSKVDVARPERRAEAGSRTHA